MKTLFLIIALLFTACFAEAQAVKTDTAQTKKEFKVDPAKVYTITLNLTAQNISLLTATPEDWQAIHSSERLNGKQIQALEGEAGYIRQVIRQQQYQQGRADFDKFNTALKKTTNSKKSE